MSFLKNYFAYTKSQQIAVVALVSLLVIVTLVNFYLPVYLQPNASVSSNSLQDSLTQWQQKKQYTSYEKTLTLTPFTFNPNTLDSVGFIKLGLRERLVHTILNYRNKGGHFYNKEGFKKMYGLHEDEYLQLANYIVIPEENKFKKHEKEKLHIDIATADTAMLNKLNGIGNKLAENIVQYRNQLGGFVSVEQLQEVWGIQPETYDKIKADCYCTAKNIKKLNLNEATFNELNQHPYLKGELTKAIVDFRKQNNYHIDKLEQLKEIPLINGVIFKRIVPYLSL